MIALAGSGARDGRIIATIGAAHCGSHFFHVVLPPLFPLLMPDFGLGGVEVGAIMTAFFLTSGLVQTPSGFLVDRIGAARVLAAGLALLGIGAIIVATATGYPALVAGAIVMGVGNAVFHPADYAILTHHVSASRIGRAYAVHTLGGSIGWALAPVTMVGVAALGGWRAAILAAALVGFGLALLVLASREEIETPGHRARPGSAPSASPRLLAGPVVACFFFFALLAAGMITVQGFVPLALHRLHDVPLVAATMAVTAYMLGMAGGTIIGGIAADRSGRHQAIVGAGLLAGGAFMLLAGIVAMPIVLLWLTVAAAGACAGVTTPSRDMIVRRSAPPGSTGKVFGFVYSGLDLGATLAPLAAGLLLDGGRPELVFVMIASVTVCAMAAALVVRPRPPEPALAV